MKKFLTWIGAITLLFKTFNLTFSKRLSESKYIIRRFKEKRNYLFMVKKGEKIKIMPSKDGITNLTIKDSNDIELTRIILLDSCIDIDTVESVSFSDTKENETIIGEETKELTVICKGKYNIIDRLIIGAEFFEVTVKIQPIIK